jgi:uncharacterized repeat protein (TIGR01451 family)
MRGVRFRSHGAIALGFITMALAACAPDRATDGSNELLEPVLTDAPLPPRVWLVKFGPLGTTATFAITATGGNLLLGETVTIDACPREEECPGATAVWQPVAGEGVVEVTVTEIASTGNTVVERLSILSELDGVSSVDNPTAPVTATVHVDQQHRATIRFKNKVVETPPEPSLRVVKNAVNGLVQAGGNMAFTIDVFSDGPGTATNVTLNDPLPAGTGIDWTTSSANCSITGVVGSQVLSCSFGDMAAGATRSVTVSSATNSTTSCGDYTNTVSVSADNHITLTSSAIIVVDGCTRDGLAGCTPGFWKQRQHFQYWTAPYTPTTAFGSVFTDVFPGKTLLQVLSTGGGNGHEIDIFALGRHTVAALLNAANGNVDYGMTPAGVISAFNAAVASGDHAQIVALHNNLEARNERECTAKD